MRGHIYADLKPAFKVNIIDGPKEQCTYSNLVSENVSI